MPLYADIMSDGNVDRNRKRVAAYRAYLKEISEFLPAETREFALSDWYYCDPRKCPHDAWVESFQIFENPAKRKASESELGS